MNRDYVLQCFLHQNPVVGEVQKVNFEPFGQDTVTAISRDHDAEIFLDKDARKWANKLTKDKAAVQALQKQVKGLQSVTSAYTKVRGRLWWACRRLIEYQKKTHRIQNLGLQMPKQRLSSRLSCCWRKCDS